MAKAELGMRIEATADRVWEVLTGPEMEEIITSLYAEKIEFEGVSQGAVLTTTLKNGEGMIRERIEFVDNDERCLRYRVIDNGPLPYTNYCGEMRVIPSGSDACTVSFQCRYIPVGMVEEDSNRFWLEHNTEFVEKLRELLE